MRAHSASPTATASATRSSAPAPAAAAGVASRHNGGGFGGLLDAALGPPARLDPSAAAGGSDGDTGTARAATPAARRHAAGQSKSSDKHTKDSDERKRGADAGSTAMPVFAAPALGAPLPDKSAAPPRKAGATPPQPPAQPAAQPVAGPSPAAATNVGPLGVGGDQAKPPAASAMAASPLAGMIAQAAGGGTGNSPAPPTAASAVANAAATSPVRVDFIAGAPPPPAPAQPPPQETPPQKAEIKPPPAAASLLLAAAIEPGSGSAAGQNDGDRRQPGEGNGSPAGATGTAAALLSAAGSAAPPAAGALPQVPINAAMMSPFVAAQVATAIRQGVGRNADRIEIHLHPESLGAIEISLRLDRDGHIGAQVKADHPETLRLLAAGAPQLEQSLRDSGLRAEAGCLSFFLRSDPGPSGNHSGSSQSGGKPARSPARAARVASVGAVSADTAPPIAGLAASHGARGAIDIRI